MKKVRVLVVEDSLTMRSYLVDCLHFDAEIEVIAEASDGKQAIEACARLRPDVVTLDMMMPVMTGLAATEHIMAYCPTPIVIVSASTNRGELFRTYEALAAGALDVIEKPIAGTDDPSWIRKLCATVKLASRVKVITHPRGRLKSPPMPSNASAAIAPEAAFNAKRFQCVAIGASTGGPQALQEVMGALPADFPLPVLLVMHISPTFGTAFAEWLNGHSSIPVKLAAHNQALPPIGVPGALMAPPDQHLIVKGSRIWLTSDSEVHSCRPSIDVLFRSLAHELGARSIGVLMTGMGRDGAQGLLSLRQAGATTIAQDEATCVVYGMSREAVLLSAATKVLPLQGIASALVGLADAGVSEPRP